MKWLRTTAFFLLLPLLGVEAKERHCTIRLHMQAKQHDPAALANSAHIKFSGRGVAIEPFAQISERDVTAFYPYHAADGTYGALFVLDDDGRVKLEALSVERRGDFMFVIVNGRAITDLQIDKRVSDGKIYIPSGLSEADIASMKKDWRLLGEHKKRR
jgi:hypothetical protein